MCPAPGARPAASLPRPTVFRTRMHAPTSAERPVPGRAYRRARLTVVPSLSIVVGRFGSGMRRHRARTRGPRRSRRVNHQRPDRGVCPRTHERDSASQQSVCRFRRCTVAQSERFTASLQRARTFVRCCSLRLLSVDRRPFLVPREAERRRCPIGIRAPQSRHTNSGCQMSNYHQHSGNTPRVLLRRYVVAMLVAS